jgi:hypothetical protein
MAASPSKAGFEAQGSVDDERRRSNMITNIFVE